MQLLEREHRRLVVNKFTHEQVFKIVGAVFAFKLLNVEQRAATFQGVLNGDNLPPLAVCTEKPTGKGVMTDVDFHAFGGAGASPVEQFTRPERVAEFSISLATGRADIYTETPVKVSGFKRVIDEQDWTITKVTHFLNNSGFTTSLELEVRLSDVEYETEDDE